MEEDLLVEIFLKVAQDLKAVIRLRCVSKSWRRLVNSQCLPRLTCNDPLKFKGHVMKAEIGDMVKKEFPPELAYRAHHDSHENDHFGKDEPLSDKLINTSGLIFLDACNGLLLHRVLIDNSSSSSSPPVYRVSNLETKSSVVVNGGGDSSDHAALAYSPAESLISFKIVAFYRQKGCIRIYSSKTGKWSPDLTFRHLLLPCILGQRWMQQTVYLNGAIYRLPFADYLLRFRTDGYQPCAQAIPLPQPLTSYKLNHIHVGIHKGQINLASFTGFYQPLKLWVLQEEEVHGNYKWIPKHPRKWVVPLGLIPRLRGLVVPLPPYSIGPIGFHPYEDVILLFTIGFLDFRFICYHLDDGNLILSKHDQRRILSGTDPSSRLDGVLAYSFPLFSCAVPLQ